MAIDLLMRKLAASHAQSNARVVKDQLAAPVAYLYSHPLTRPQAEAFLAINASVATPEQTETWRAWLMAVVLTHGTGVLVDLDPTDLLTQP